MASIPQLTKEDADQFDVALQELLAKSEATVALIVERAGYLLHHQGDAGDWDLVTVATLASNAYNATDFMAQQVGEPRSTGLYLQGETRNSLIVSIEESCLLVILFRAELAVGMVKYYAANAVKTIAAQLAIAQQRAPGVTFDLIDLNPADGGELFRKKEG